MPEIQHQSQEEPTHVCGYVVTQPTGKLTSQHFLVRKTTTSPFLCATFPGEEFHVARSLIVRVRCRTTKGKADAIRNGTLAPKSFHLKPGVTPQAWLDKL